MRPAQVRRHQDRIEEIGHPPHASMVWSIWRMVLSVSRERGADAAVVGDVVERKDAVLAILQPFLRRTIAADGESPGV